MKYEVVLKDKFYLRELIESITLKDSLDQISYQAELLLKIPASGLDINPSDKIRISGTLYGTTTMHPLLDPGVVWECSSDNQGSKHMDVLVYDRTIYLAKSEEEYLMPAGQTASQRLKKYASDWGIKLSTVPDTKTKLKKSVYRARPIYSTIMADLQETVKSGGDMFIPRMTTAGLILFKIGSNETVWKLGSLESVSQKRTLEGAVTKVKVLGTEDRKSTGKKNEELPSKVLAIVSGQTSALGTLQKVVQDDDVKTAAAAKKLANDVLTGVQETYTLKGPDINTLRAGDAVIYNELKLIVISVNRKLGTPGSMTIEAGTENYIRRRFFLNYA